MLYAERTAALLLPLQQIGAGSEDSHARWKRINRSALTGHGHRLAGWNVRKLRSGGDVRRDALPGRSDPSLAVRAVIDVIVLRRTGDARFGVVAGGEAGACLADRVFQSFQTFLCPQARVARADGAADGFRLIRCKRRVQVQPEVPQFVRSGAVAARAVRRTPRTATSGGRFRCAATHQRSKTDEFASSSPSRPRPPPHAPSLGPKRRPSKGCDRPNLSAPGQKVKYPPLDPMAH